MSRRLNRIGGRWTTRDPALDVCLAFVSEVERTVATLDFEGEAPGDAKLLEERLARVRAALGLEARAQGTTEPEAGTGADSTELANPVAIATRHASGGTALGVSGKSEADGPRGILDRLLSWLRSPGAWVTVGAIAATALVVWFVSRDGRGAPTEPAEFGFTGSLPGRTGGGGLRCPEGAEARSRSLGQGRRAVWCESRAADGQPVRAPYVELDDAGRLLMIGRYEADQREGAFVMFNTGPDAVKSELMCFRQGARVPSARCEEGGNVER